eukprot:m.124087 g.124087  ORF g.124087 m.124087 type:complete len:343 (-) comp29040_c0_seq1:37-1065(-)
MQVSVLANSPTQMGLPHRKDHKRKKKQNRLEEERTPPKPECHFTTAANELNAMLDTIRGSTITEEDVDIVVSGGGLRGYFCNGVFDTFRKAKGMRIRRIAGASAGAWCAAFYFCGVSVAEWTSTYWDSEKKLKEGKSILDAYHELRGMMPKDAHIICSGRVFISITTLSATRGIHNLTISEFESTDDLVDACIASSTAPFLTTNGWGKRYRNEIVLDGGIINNVPCFADNDLRQIVIDLGKVAYPIGASITTVDPCIEGLVIRGAMEARRFLDGHNRGHHCIDWLEKGASTDDVHSFRWKLMWSLYWCGVILVVVPSIFIYKLIIRTMAVLNWMFYPNVQLE